MGDPKVVYIIGKGRSGSTLLDNALGQVDGIFSAGEISRRWRWRPLDEYPCGCGKTLAECDVWSAVLGLTRSGLAEEFGPSMSLTEVTEWERRVFRWSSVRRAVTAEPGELAGWEPLDRYVRFASILYRSLAEATSSRVIVDSTKWPLHPGLLGLVPGIQPYALHLVRDPRAVAFSWQRTRVYPGLGEAMPKFGPVNSALSWNARNLASEVATSRLEGRSMRLRYEDFVEAPRSWLAQILETIGEQPEKLPFDDEHTLSLGVSHTVMGNPSRFLTGSVEIRPDVEWKAKLGRGNYALVTVLTLPILARYGYVLNASDSGSAANS